MTAVPAPRHLFLDVDGTVYRCERLVGAIVERVGSFMRRYGVEDVNVGYASHGSAFRASGAQRDLAEYHAYVHDDPRVVALVDELEPLSGLRGLLKRARARGVRVHAFTSASRAHAERVLARQGLTELVDSIVDSAAVGGLTKREAPCFYVAERLAGARANEALLIDDCAGNVAAARAAGWSAVHADAADWPRRHAELFGYPTPRILAFVGHAGCGKSAAADGVPGLVAHVPQSELFHGRTPAGRAAMRGEHCASADYVVVEWNGVDPTEGVVRRVRELGGKVVGVVAGGLQARFADASFADATLVNDGSLEQLHERVRALCARLWADDGAKRARPSERAAADDGAAERS